MPDYAAIAGQAAPFVSAVITGVSAAWLTAVLTFRRTKSEKLWNEMLSAYQKILDHLGDVCIVFDNMLEANGLHKEISEEDKSEFKQRYLVGRKSLERYLYTSGLLMRPEVNAHIRQLLSDLQQAQSTTDWTTYLESSSRAVWQCITSINATAKKDLAK